jgi:hypothetical protein
MVEMSAPEIENRFVAIDDDVIFDTQGRLVWLKKDTWLLCGKWLNWVQSRDYAEELNRKKFAGYSNWRLPTAIEAKSLFDKRYQNKDHMGQLVFLHPAFPQGSGFLCWTGDVRNKIQAVRFGYRKGTSMFDDIYRVSRGAARFVRSLSKDE